MRRGAVWSTVVAMGFGAAAGCSPGGSDTPSESSTPTSGNESASRSVTPSITREVPPERRQHLAQLAPDQLCGLVGMEEVRKLAFPVEPGQPREIGFDPPIRGCTFKAPNGVRSVLIGAQPAGMAQIGHEEVALGEVKGMQTMHANDCTVFADVEGATLQIAVTAGEADTTQCDTAQGVAQYVLAGLVR
jgi:hypothetical protein